MTAAATAAIASSYPPPFDTDEGIKAIPSIMHPYLHRQPAISNFVQIFLTDVDATLYSSEFRAHLQSLVSDTEVQTLLADPETTRQQLYRFYVKGSNDYLLIQQYLQTKHGVLFAESLPHTFESDWDMSILLNPRLSDTVYKQLFDTIRVVCLEKLMEFSQQLNSIPEYGINILSGIETAYTLIKESERYAPFRGWKIKFKNNTQRKLSVNDSIRGKGVDQELMDRLGLSGKGAVVRSNYTPFEGAQFYLARLMANVVAGGGIFLPVEIIDIAIPYKGDELELAWESHSEMHFVYNGFDYRILSPVGFFVDLAKTIRNAEESGNSRRTRKLGKRMQRMQRLLNEIIRPYGAQNATIQANLTRLSTSRSAAGSAVRALTRRLENRRPIVSAADLFEDE
jgi:hypothetical protein